ncbi:CAP domain-containing protein [Corallococcus exiguus]|nr:CAP domain-containing protein [Corallococcus exiguus]
MENSRRLMVLGAALSLACGAEGVSLAQDEAPRVPLAALDATVSSATANPDYCLPVKIWLFASSQLESQLMTLINQRRAAGANCGGSVKLPVPPLATDNALTCAAHLHAKDMFTNVFLSHVGSTGSTPLKRITSAGFTPLSYAGEVIAAGYGTPEDVVAGWMASAEDCATLMSPTFTHANAGFGTVSGTTYGFWAVALGRP